MARTDPRVRKGGCAEDARITVFELGRGLPRQILRRYVAGESVEPDAEIERRAPDLPLILGKDAQVVPVVLLVVGGGALREADRYAVAENVAHVPVGEDLLIGGELLGLHAGLEGVCAGHVGRREPLGGAVGVIGPAAVRGRRAV